MGVWSVVTVRSAGCGLTLQDDRVPVPFGPSRLNRIVRIVADSDVGTRRSGVFF